MWAKRERMKGWQKVWDACMKAARGEDDTDAAKGGCDNDKNDV